MDSPSPDCILPVAPSRDDTSKRHLRSIDGDQTPFPRGWRYSIPAKGKAIRQAPRSGHAMCGGYPEFQIRKAKPSARLLVRPRQHPANGEALPLGRHRLPHPQA